MFRDPLRALRNITNISPLGPKVIDGLQHSHTVPPLFTDATAGALERHVTAVVTPDATVMSGVSVRSSPMVMLADDGETPTSGAAATVTCAELRIVVSTVETAVIVA